MPSIAAAEPHVNPTEWERRVAAWCQHCENIGQLTHMVRGARGSQELAAAIDVIREYKNPGVAREVIKCL